MKKIICLILALLMLVSVISCNTTPAGNEDTTDSIAASDTDTPTTKASKRMFNAAGVKLTRIKPTKAEIVLKLNIKD